MPTPTITALRRYPVKSMGGESLRAVDLDARGVVGDRWWAIVDDDGRLASGKDTRRFRRRDPVFTYAAATGDDGGLTVSRGGQHWAIDDPALAELLSTEMGAPVRPRTEADVPHHDDGQVSLVGTASLAWCAERFGGEPDPRRLRANLVVETTEPFVEEDWQTVRIGDSVLTAAGPTPRCRMVDITQDGQTPDARWLGPLADQRDLCLAVYLSVERPGRISLGDPVAAE